MGKEGVPQVRRVRYKPLFQGQRQVSMVVETQQKRKSGEIQDLMTSWLGGEHMREEDFEVGSYMEVSLSSKTESQRERPEWETRSLGCGQDTDVNAS